MHAYAQAAIYMWQSVDNLQALILSLYSMKPGDQIQVQVVKFSASTLTSRATSWLAPVHLFKVLVEYLSL